MPKASIIVLKVKISTSQTKQDSLQFRM